jgi:hypothetical protein
LAFDFKADLIPKDGLWRNLANTEQVYTGHASGTITINIREADDVEREKLRVDLGESKRTLIGHFRHEIAIYWDVVKDRREPFKQLFGDDNNSCLCRGRSLQAWAACGLVGASPPMPRCTLGRFLPRRGRRISRW